MKKIIFSAICAFALIGPFFVPKVDGAPSKNACWGQATKAFAALGVMGEHSSNQANPRAGLRNLARALYDDGNGPLEDDTLQALGVYLNQALNLQIDACM